MSNKDNEDYAPLNTQIDVLKLLTEPKNNYEDITRDSGVLMDTAVFLDKTIAEEIEDSIVTSSMESVLGESQK